MALKLEEWTVCQRAQNNSWSQKKKENSLLGGVLSLGGAFPLTPSAQQNSGWIFDLQASAILSLYCPDHCVGGHLSQQPHTDRMGH